MPKGRGFTPLSVNKNPPVSPGPSCSGPSAVIPVKTFPKARKFLSRKKFLEDGGF